MPAMKAWLRGHRRVFYLGYGLYWVSVMVLTYYVIFQRLFAVRPALPLAELYFLAPGILFILSFLEVEVGEVFFLAPVLSNAFMYAWVPLLVVQVFRRIQVSQMGWRDLSRFLCLFALWLFLAIPRRGCCTPWTVLADISLGVRGWEELLWRGPLLCVEGVVVAGTAGFGVDALVRLLGPHYVPVRLASGRGAGLLSLAVGYGLVAAWGLAAIGLCWWWGAALPCARP